MPAPLPAALALVPIALAQQVTGVAPPSNGVPPILTWTSPEAGDRLGQAVAAAGDLDGDGWIDVAVGAPRASAGGTDRGVVRVISTRTGAVVLSVAGASDYAAFGFALDAGRDVDGDLVPDVVAGAPGASPAGEVRVLSGSTGGLLRVWPGAEAGERYGEAVALLGDSDGDGITDVAIGAPLADAGGTNSGRVEVRSGATGALLFEVLGGPWDHLGKAVGAPGDVDLDGRPDVLIGAPFTDVLAFNGGSARIHSGRTGGLLASFDGTGIGDQLGHWVAGAGDADADGTPDVALGVPGADVGAIDTGSAQVRSGASGALLFAVSGPASGVGLGTVSSAGDVDRDGHDDVLVGAPQDGPDQAGIVRLLSGRDGSVLASVAGIGGNDWYGRGLAAGGDVDQDGWPDLVVGAPGHDDDPTQHGYVQVISGRIVHVHAIPK